MNESKAFIIYATLPSFSKPEGNYALVNTADSMVRRQMKKNPAVPCLLSGGKVAHFENDTASEK